MKRSGSVAFVSLGFVVAALQAADATSPVDYTDRNARYVPGGSVQPAKKAPAVNDGIQQKRVTPDTIDKKPAAVGERRAGIDVGETREKVVQEKQVRPVEKFETTKSRYDQQLARVSTAGDVKKPPTVARYQDSLTAASATNMARFPAISGATNAKINRFVFRKNGGELADSAQRASVVPAAGGSAPAR